MTGYYSRPGKNQFIVYSSENRGGEKRTDF